MKRDYLKIQQINNLAMELSDKQISNDSQSIIQQEEQLGLILEQSKKNTLKFIEDIKEKALTPISQTILEQYNGQIKPSYSIKEIQSMIEKRISKMIRNKKIKKNWNLQDIILLLWIVSKYIEVHQNLSTESFTNQDWIEVSKLIPGSNPKGCMFKFVSLKKIKLSICSWQKEEEQMLRSLVKKWGLNRWKQISEYLYQNNLKQKIFRTPKQCRQHWNCYLDPKLKKGPWSQNQDIKLLSNVLSNRGQKKWSSIKYLFEGRTENALKNRFNLLIQRQRKTSTLKNQNQLIIEFLKGKVASQTSLEKQHEFIQNSSNQRDQIFEEHDNKKHNQKININNQQQMDEELIEKSPHHQQMLKIDPENQKKQQPAQTFFKSIKSSFKVPKSNSKQIQQNKFIQNDSKQNQQINCTTNEVNTLEDQVQKLEIQNIGTITSIYTNEQGFFSNVIYKKNL